MTFLPKEYLDYDMIEEKKKSLTSLVTNLNVIALQDSLQRLGTMPVAEREKTIDGMITKIEEEEKAAEEERLNQLLKPTNPTETTTAASGGLRLGIFIIPQRLVLDKVPSQKNGAIVSWKTIGEEVKKTR